MNYLKLGYNDTVGVLEHVDGMKTTQLLPLSGVMSYLFIIINSVFYSRN